jgi:hypothetical protein
VHQLGQQPLQTRLAFLISYVLDRYFSKKLNPSFSQLAAGSKIPPTITKKVSENMLSLMTVKSCPSNRLTTEGKH